MIIHINGPSGSGKTTLGQRLAKHKEFMVIDSDDIDDKNALRLLAYKKYNNLFTEDGMEQYFKMKEAANKEALKKIIEVAKQKKKILVVVGLTLTIPGRHKKYRIGIDPETCFRRVTARTVASMCKNAKAIQQLVNDENNTPDRIFMTMLHEYKIRVGVPPSPPDYMKMIEKSEKNAKRNGITVATSDDIYQELVAAIQ